MDRLAIKSPAKLNLFLKILGKRPDGYHNIETVFERIDLCDKITLAKQKTGIRITCDNPDLPLDEKNLAYKAARLLFEAVNAPGGAAIDIKKRIPVAAGLGGGSSNAASVLLGLNTLYGFGLSQERLLNLSRKLGADVAFFIHEARFASGESRGDIITPIKAKRRLWHVLVAAPFGLSTKDVYESLGFYEKEESQSLKDVVSSLENRDFESLRNIIHNDLEKVALARHREIGQVKDALFNAGIKAIVSGSGPAVFGLTKTRREAIGAGKKLKRDVLAGKKEWQVYAVCTI